MGQNAIEVKNISKTFKVEIEDKDKKNLFGKATKVTVENKVLDDVSFNIKKGEVVGIIGRNGSGKSTLLSIIANILNPDSGTIEISGKIASILELGMGFHPDMSGRENIYLKGELYGFSRKELDSKIDTIIEYSGIKEYIDNPVRTYSSGMNARLAFAIMVNVDSEIMLVDEVLSVGDIAFRIKAKEHFKKLAKSGKTVVFVSHSTSDLVDMCNRVIWIEAGKVEMDGNPKNVCAVYENKMSESPDIIFDLAEAGVADAEYKLALMYRDGKPFGVDLELYKSWLKKASDQGHTQAQVLYADMLYHSKENEDIEMASSLYWAAANKGNTEARQKIATLSVKEDKLRTTIKQFLSKMADTGDQVSQFRYADYLLKTSWTNEDKKESFIQFMKSAEQGYPGALYQIAIMYRDGVGTAKDSSCMEKYLELASIKGNMNAIITLADIYNQGKLLPKNDKKAFDLYLKGANLGNSKCMYQVALMYKDGLGTDVNVNESEKWFRLYSYSPIMWSSIWVADWVKNSNCERQDVVDACYKIASDLGNIYSISKVIDNHILGTSVGRDTFQRVFDKLILLANNGSVDAMRRIGNYYYSGIGVEKNYSEAYKWYFGAAQYGDSWCRNRIGEMLRDGRGTEKDLDGAIAFFKKSASTGNVSAVNNLLDLYTSCTLNDFSLFSETLVLLKSLAKNGNIDAIRRIGNMYYSGGSGIVKDQEQAMIWYTLASNLGDAWSNTRLFEYNRQKS